MDRIRPMYECPYCNKLGLQQISSATYVQCASCMKVSCTVEGYVLRKACLCFGGFILFCFLGLASSSIEHDHIRYIWTGAFFASLSCLFASIRAYSVKTGRVTYMV